MARKLALSAQSIHLLEGRPQRKKARKPRASAPTLDAEQLTNLSRAMKKRAKKKKVACCGRR